MAEEELSLDQRYPENPIYVQVVTDLGFDPAFLRVKSGHRPFADLREERLAKQQEET